MPLRIYAARATADYMSIPWLTSHIDVTPTILDLLGIDRSREFEQGDAIWDPEITAAYFVLFCASGFRDGWVLLAAAIFHVESDLRDGFGELATAF